MKKKILISLSIILILGFLLYLNMNKKNGKFFGTNVVTTFYPVYIGTLNITDGVKNIKVSNVTKNVTTCLHDYTLSTSQMADITKADILIVNGAGMEPFLYSITKSNKAIDIVDSSVGTSILEGHEEHNGHEEYNSHIYLDIQNYQIQVENICSALVKLNPENAYIYTQNKQKYVEQLDNLSRKWNDLRNELRGTPVVIYNSALQYIANMAGLDVVSNLEIDHESGISSQEVIDTIKTIKRQKVKYILVSNDYDEDIINSITSGLDCEIIKQDLFVYGENTKSAYIDSMNSNLHELTKLKKD